jgi:hypothetical protein
VVDLRLHRGLVNFGAVFINNDHTTSLIVPLPVSAEGLSGAG